MNFSSLFYKRYYHVWCWSCKLRTGERREAKYDPSNSWTVILSKKKSKRFYGPKICFQPKNSFRSKCSNQKIVLNGKNRSSLLKFRFFYLEAKRAKSINQSINHSKRLCLRGCVILNSLLVDQKEGWRLIFTAFQTIQLTNGATKGVTKTAIKLRETGLVLLIVRF